MEIVLDSFMVLSRHSTLQTCYTDECFVVFLLVPKISEVQETKLRACAQPTDRRSQEAVRSIAVEVTSGAQPVRELTLMSVICYTFLHAIFFVCKITRK
jgi:hypothetical protein